jgi:hypothetical protein
MSTLGFEKYVEPLKIYLQKFKEVRTAPSMSIERIDSASRSSLLMIILSLLPDVPNVLARFSL